MNSFSNRQNTDPADSIKRFWDNYLQYLVNKDIKPTVARWYVIRIEQYIKLNPGKRLAEHCPADVTSYLAEQGRNMKIRDWQFRQIVDAIQKLKRGQISV